MAAPLLPSLIDIERELASRSFREYAELAFPYVEPGVRFLPNWHIDAICDHMQAVFSGDIKKLVINVPPGAMKSLLVCTLYPTWAWGPANDPGRRMIFGSYAQTLSTRDSLRSRQLIESDWYQARWGEAADGPWRRVVRNRQAWNKEGFANLAAGMRQATSVGKGITGFHAHDLICDDPIKPQECTALALEKSNEWWFKTMTTRALPGVSRVIIMQRLHEVDPAGVALSEHGYHALIIPMEYEKNVRTRTPLEFEDPRTVEGEPLWSERWTNDELDTLKTNLGPREVAAQLQQRPAPADGAIFKKSYLQRWQVLPPLHKSRVILSIDCNFKKTSNGSYAALQAWVAYRNNYYLVDQVRERFAFSELVDATRAMALKWRTYDTIIIEDKANGPALISSIKDELHSVVACEPYGDKVARANAVEPVFAAGQVYIPEDSRFPWVRDYVLELLRFPVGANDDQVDATTQALHRLKSQSMEHFTSAMEKLRND